MNKASMKREFLKMDKAGLIRKLKKEQVAIKILQKKCRKIKSQIEMIEREISRA